MKDFKKFSLLEETETRTSDGTAPILNDLQQIGEFHRVVKNYTKMKKIEAMTNTTQIPASEVERIEREAEQHPVYKRLITSNKLHAVIWSSGYRKGVVAEYLHREREAKRFAHWIVWNRWTEFKGDSTGAERYSRFMGVLPQNREWKSIDELYEMFLKSPEPPSEP